MFPQFQTRLSVLRWLLSFVTQSKLASVGSSFPAYFLLESIRRRRKRSPAVLHLVAQEWCQGMFDLKSRVAALSSKATTAKYQPFRVTIRVLTCTFYYQEAVRADSCKLSHQCILWSWECGCVGGKLSISYRGGVDDFECQNSKPGPFQIQLCLTLQGQSICTKHSFTFLTTSDGIYYCPRFFAIRASDNFQLVLKGNTSAFTYDGCWGVQLVLALFTLLLLRYYYHII